MKSQRLLDGQVNNLKLGDLYFAKKKKKNWIPQDPKSPALVPRCLGIKCLSDVTHWRAEM